MIRRSISVKVLKEGATKIHLRLLASNSKMIIDRSEFEKRLDSGVYEVKD